jgi:hypothetical protein
MSVSTTSGRKKNRENIGGVVSCLGSEDDCLKEAKVARIGVSSPFVQSFAPSMQMDKVIHDMCLASSEKLMYERVLSERQAANQALLNAQKELSDAQKEAALNNEKKESSAALLIAHKEASAALLIAQKEASVTLHNLQKEAGATLSNQQTKHTDSITSLLQDSNKSLDKVLDFSLKTQAIQAPFSSGGPVATRDVANEEKRIALQGRMDNAMKELQQATSNANKAREANDHWAIEFHETQCNELKQLLTGWGKEKLNLL